MSYPVWTVDASQSVVGFFKLLSESGNSLSSRKRLVVVRGTRVMGVIDRGQIFEAASLADPSLTVDDACSRDFETIGEDEYAYQALRQMSLHDRSFLVVTDEQGNLAGYVSRGDLTRALKQKIEDETLIEG